MKKTLFEFYEELQSLSFDKKKVQGLVKRANTSGYDIYYAYHEDGYDTWKRGWSGDDYMNDNDDVKLFSATNLIGKSHGGGSFRKGSTYTAECAIFVFCPLNTLMADPDLREMRIEAEKRRAAKYAASRWEESIERKIKLDKWNGLPDAVKNRISILRKNIDENIGKEGSRKPRKQMEQEIERLGGDKPILGKWQQEVLTFENAEAYIEFRKKEAVDELLAKAESKLEIDN